MKKTILLFFISLLFILPLVSFAQPENIDILGAIVRLARAIRSIVVAVSVLFIVIGGFYFIIAQGEPQNIEKAKKILVYVVIGLIVAFGAEGILSLILNALNVSPGEYSEILPSRHININTIIENIVELISSVVTALAVIFIVLAGFNFITARGDESKIDKAKSMLLWALIGVGIVAGAKLITKAIINLIPK